MKRRYVTADVFTDRMFGGNPLAVVLDTAELSTKDMQSIALEFNYAETTFVFPPRDAAHTASVRIFTPRTEVPFAGHPNVGTAFLLGRESAYRAAAAAGRLEFEEAAGLVPVRLMTEHGQIVGAELQAPERLSRRSCVAPQKAADCLSLSTQDLALGLHAPQVVEEALLILPSELKDPVAQIGRPLPEILRGHPHLLNDAPGLQFDLSKRRGSVQTRALEKDPVEIGQALGERAPVVRIRVDHLIRVVREAVGCPDRLRRGLGPRGVGGKRRRTLAAAARAPREKGENPGCK